MLGEVISTAGANHELLRQLEFHGKVQLEFTIE